MKANLKTYLLPVLLCFQFLIIISCDKEENDAASIIGVWESYSHTDSDGEVTSFILRCPDIFTISATTISIEDFYEIESPCLQSDITVITYVLDGKNLTTTDVDNYSETFEILELNSTVLKFLSRENTIIEFRKK